MSALAHPARTSTSATRHGATRRTAAVAAKPQVGAVAGGLPWHDAATQGMPVDEVHTLLRSLKQVPEDDTFRVLGITRRTLQRRAAGASGRLDANSSDRALRLLAALAQATDVLGGADAAEHWLLAPALGLDGRRPIDLLPTSAGATLVNTLLTRMDHGVYA